MIIYQTNLAKESTIPTQLQFKRIAMRRNLLHGEKEERLLYQLEAGEQGELALLEFLKEFGKSHWVVIRNVWLNYYGRYESDIILITTHACYVFEVKNYTGHFEYKNNRCFNNGIRNKNNCVAQAERAYINLWDLCREISPNIEVHGALVFIGKHNDVEIHSEVEGIQVIQRNQLKNYIQNIVRQEELYPECPIDKEKIIAHLESYEEEKSFAPESFHPETLKQARSGVSCRKCANFDVELSRKFVTCACGFTELRTEAMVRTVAEYGLLVFDHKEIKRSNIQNFIGLEMSSSYLIKILKEYFGVNPANKYTSYQNKWKSIYNKMIL